MTRTPISNIRHVRGRAAREVGATAANVDNNSLNRSNNQASSQFLELALEQIPERIGQDSGFKKGKHARDDDMTNM